jgi:hypothetical protein
MRKKFKPGDIVEFGYGQFQNGKYDIYRTILLLEDTGNTLWRAVLMHDTSSYYADGLDHFILDDETKLVWRDKRKKALDGKAATC